jgi:hypothetical protein
MEEFKDETPETEETEEESFVKEVAKEVGMVVAIEAAVIATIAGVGLAVAGINKFKAHRAAKKQTKIDTTFEEIINHNYSKK